MLYKKEIFNNPQNGIKNIVNQNEINIYEVNCGNEIWIVSQRISCKAREKPGMFFVLKKLTIPVVIQS